MIRVNLLPEAQKARAKKKTPRVKREIPLTWIILGLVVVLITCAGLGVFHLRLQTKADVIQTDIHHMQIEIKKLKIDIQKVEAVKSQRLELNDKLAVIDRLKSAQKGPVFLLDQLASCIPAKVWISSMTENGKTMNIEGKALEHENISRFMRNLEKSEYFSNVELASSLATGKGKSDLDDVKTFKLACQIKGPEQFL